MLLYFVSHNLPIMFLEYMHVHVHVHEYMFPFAVDGE